MRNQSYHAGANRRVMIFIDGSNLYHVLKQNVFKQDLDYRKFAEKLSGNRELIRTYYYNIRQESPDNPALAASQDRFLNALYETEYLEVKLGIWKQRGNTMVEKGVDVMIASDLISHAYEDHYDTAILVSGDADFYPALQVVKDTGKQVEVAAFDSNLSAEAARMTDRLIKFNRSWFDDLWMTASQKSDNRKTAQIRQSVTDEAASPNGEDKAAARGGRGGSRRKPFTAGYPTRRKPHPTRSESAERNGHQPRETAPSVRKTATRRSLSTVLAKRPDKAAVKATVAEPKTETKPEPIKSDPSSAPKETKRRTPERRRMVIRSGRPVRTARSGDAAGASQNGSTAARTAPESNPSQNGAPSRAATNGTSASDQRRKSWIAKMLGSRRSA